MKDFFNAKTWKIALGILFTALFISLIIIVLVYKNNDRAQAASGDNVSGFAWSENFGWISFNSTECDIDGNGFIDGNGIDDDLDCGGDNSSTLIVDYGAKVDVATGQMSGFAWSPNIGWIYFGDSNNIPEALLAEAPTIAGYTKEWPIIHKGSTIAEQLNPIKTVTGWAKILTLENDGWMKMMGASIPGGDPYGVAIDMDTGFFSGWSWNATSTYGVGAGWVSYNSDNCDIDGNGFIDGNGIDDDLDCGGDNAATPIIDYKVKSNFNTPPSVPVSSLSAPNWGPVQACLYEARQALLRWDNKDVDSGAEIIAYQLILTDNDGGSSSFNSGICTGLNTCTGVCDSTKCKLDTNALCFTNNLGTGSQCQYILDSSDLEYGTLYSWQVKVWDDWGASSGLIPGPDFITYLHEFPNVGNPADYLGRVSQDEQIKFNATSSYYTFANPNTSPTTCDETNCLWNWTFEVGGNPDANTTFAPPTTFASSSPIVVFSTENTRDVYVAVTDSDLYTCTSMAVVEVNKKLPSWIETR